MESSNPKTSIMRRWNLKGIECKVKNRLCRMEHRDGVYQPQQKVIEMQRHLGDASLKCHEEIMILSGETTTLRTEMDESGKCSKSMVDRARS